MKTSEVKQVTGLQLLRQPFPPHQISKLPKPLKKDAQKGKCDVCGGYHGLPAVHLDYVGHAALTDRLLDADPAWTWEPLALGADGLPAYDHSGGLWIRLTVLGVSRLGYGNAEEKGYMDVGAREKEVIGDALRNAAMRFGAALDLWHKGQLHVDSENAAPAPDADSEVDETIPPAGFAEWWKAMESVAGNGLAELEEAFRKTTNKSIKKFATSQRREQWKALKDSATKPDAVAQ